MSKLGAIFDEASPSEPASVGKLSAIFDEPTPSEPASVEDGSLRLSGLFDSPPKRDERAPLVQPPKREGRVQVAPRQARARRVAKRLRSLALDVLAGALAFFFQTLFCITFASMFESRCAWVTRVEASELARVAVLAYLLCGIPYMLATELPYAMPTGPDLAIAPMLAGIAEIVGDAEDPLCVLLVISSVSALAAGLLIAGMSRYGLLRFAEYLPFPVVCGLLASVGGGLVKAAAGLASSDFSLALAALVALADLAVQACSESTIIRLVVCVVAPSFLAAYRAPSSWYFEREALGAGAFSSWPPAFRAVKDVAWSREELEKTLSATSAALEATIAMVLVTVLKAPIVDAALRKALASFEPSQRRNNVEIRKSVRRMPSLGALTEEAIEDEVSKRNHEAATWREMVLLGATCVLSVVCGCGSILGQQVSMSVVVKGLGVRPTKLPGAVCCALAAVALAFPASWLVSSRAAVPKFVYAGLIASQGLALIYKWLVEPASYLPVSELGVAAVIVALTVTRGASAGVAAGLATSVALFALASVDAPVVKYAATGLTFRSNVDRDARDRYALDAHGDRLIIMALQGFLFFGNGCKITAFVTALIDDDDDHAFKGGVFVVLDLGLCLGADASAIDALLEAAAIVAATHRTPLAEPALILAAAPQSVRAALKLRPDADALLALAPDADRAFGSCEDRLLDSARQRKPVKPPPRALTGFGESLRHSLARTALLAAEDGSDVLACLDQALAPHSTLRRLREKDTLMSRARAGEPVDPHVDALYIVAQGRIAVRHDPQQSTGGQLFGRPSATFVRRSRSGHPRHSQAYRLGELGPGSLIGIEEYTTRVRSAGVFVAASNCVLHELSFNVIDDVAKNNPTLGLYFFRLVAAVLADDIDALKFRLSSAVDALYATPLTKPVKVATLRALAHADSG